MSQRTINLSVPRWAGLWSIRLGVVRQTILILHVLASPCSVFSSIYLFQYPLSWWIWERGGHLMFKSQPQCIMGRQLRAPMDGRDRAQRTKRRQDHQASLCVCLCVFVSVSVCQTRQEYVCAWISMSNCICACECVCLNVCFFRCLCPYVCVHEWVCPFVPLCAPIHICVCLPHIYVCSTVYMLHYWEQ